MTATLPYIPDNYDQQTFVVALNAINDELGGLSAAIADVSLTASTPPDNTDVLKSIEAILADVTDMSGRMDALRDLLLAEARKRGADIVTLESKIQTATESMAMQIQLITSSLKQNAAGILQIRSAMTTLKSALASQVTILTAAFNNNAASITAEQTARADADTALASSITTLTATVNANTAAITEEQSARATADSVEAAARIALGTSLNNSIASATSSLQTQIGNLTGSLYEAISTTEALEALTDSKIVVFIKNTEPTTGMAVGDYWIDLDDYRTNRYNSSTIWVAAADTRIPDAVRSLTNRTITNNITIRLFVQASAPSTGYYEGDLWYKTTDNKIYLYGPTGWVVVTEAKASSNTRIATTVSGHTATITTYGDSINGLEGKYGVTIDVNGYVSGFVMNNGSGSSSFRVNADYFSVTKPGATAATFTVEDGKVKINGNLIVNGSVNTTQVSDGAITNISTASHGQVWGTGGAVNWTVIVETTISIPENKEVLIYYGCRQDYTYAHALTGFELYRKKAGSAAVKIWESGGTAGDNDWPTFTVIDTDPGTGDTTYQIGWYAGSSALSNNFGTLTALLLKR